MRKDSDFNVTDKINISIKSQENLNTALHNNLDYICSETLGNSLTVVDELQNGVEVEIEKGIATQIKIEKV